MKLLIVDDHVLFREGLAAIIRSETDIELVGLAGSVKEAVAVARDTRPDIIMMDFYMQDGTGADAAQQILSEQPDCKIIFLSFSEDDENLITAIRSGAKGYLLKTIGPKKLLASIRSVDQGEAALSSSMTVRLMEELARTRNSSTTPDGRLNKLSEREREVLILLASGASNQEIAEKLVLSENTVKHHIHSIYEKLEVGNRREAIVFAREHGLSPNNN
jgi:DNA-binding NarL/FixJ family response regulator